MLYVVNARLVNGSPELRIINPHTGHVRMRWRMEKIEEMFESGEIRREEFLQPEKYGMKLLLKNLFLIACSESLEKPPRPSATATTDPSTADHWRFSPRIGHSKSVR